MNPAAAAGAVSSTLETVTRPVSSTRPHTAYTPTIVTTAMSMCITEPAVMTHIRRGYVACR